MSEYSPFLKFKQGEITALIQLSSSDRSSIIPLLELPRDDDWTEDDLITKISKNSQRMKKKLGSSFSFYIDNYEIPDEIEIYGDDSYSYLIDSFNDFDIIPIVGFDRSEKRNSIGINYANTKAKKIGLRITSDYFSSFLAYEEDLKLLLDQVGQDVSCALLLDCRYIDDTNISNYEKSILNLLENADKLQRFTKIIISGSSIPQPIVKKVKTNTNVRITRNEIVLFKKIISKHPNISLVFGDYTVVSPEYSEIDVEPELLLNVMASKIIYSLLDTHYVCRGRAINPYGYEQYFSHAEKIIEQSFFRGKDFSWGDNYLFEKTISRYPRITQSTIIAPTVNAHIKFMISEISKHSI